MRDMMKKIIILDNMLLNDMSSDNLGSYESGPSGVDKNGEGSDEAGPSGVRNDEEGLDEAGPSGVQKDEEGSDESGPSGVQANEEEVTNEWSATGLDSENQGTDADVADNA